MERSRGERERGPGARNLLPRVSSGSENKRRNANAMNFFRESEKEKLERVGGHSEEGDNIGKRLIRLDRR